MKVVSTCTVDSCVPGHTLPIETHTGFNYKMVLVNIHTYRNRTQWYCTSIYYNYTAIYYIQLLYYIQLFSNVVGNNQLQAVTVVRVAVNCIQAVNNFLHTGFCLSCTAHHTLHFPNFSVEEHLSSSLSRKTYILSHYDTLDTRHVQKSLQSTTQVSSVPLPNGHVSLLKYSRVHELRMVCHLYKYSSNDDITNITQYVHMKWIMHISLDLTLALVTCGSLACSMMCMRCTQ